MRSYLIAITLIFSLIFVTPIQSQSCRVKDVATNKLTRCKFPFKFKGETHNGCIDYIDVKNGKKVPGDPWCSTKVSGPDREHVTGGDHYGECGSSCPSSGSCRVRDQATKRLKQCEFPFKFKGETYYGCIDHIDVVDGKKIPSESGVPWCSTKVRGSDREHVPGGDHYGDCNASCPGADEASDERRLKKQRATFDSFDKNGNGFLTKREFSRGFDALNIAEDSEETFTTSQLNELFTAIDNNNDKRLDFDEFQQLNINAGSQLDASGWAAFIPQLLGLFTSFFGAGGGGAGLLGGLFG